jgi:Zn-dependent M28 family amino/carboxypeptidase
MTRQFVVLAVTLSTFVGACASRGVPARQPSTLSGPDTVAISALARDLSSDARRGRGPWTRENELVARELAAQLTALGARPLFGNQLLVPFTSEPRPRDTVYNVAAVLPARSGNTTGQLVGLTAHFDHLGVGRPDARGDSIYNGFLDDAIGIAMIMDVAKRWVKSPGDRPLAILFFNLEEQGLLGSKALVARADAGPVLDRMGLLVGVDAGSPAGEAIRWQLMGASPPHAGGRLTDSLARARGWTDTTTPPRAISDVFPFSQRGVPVVFPIPGATWKGYTTEQRAEAMRQFDHYHQPADEWRADFPMTGTAAFADWLWDIVRHATDARRTLR